MGDTSGSLEGACGDVNSPKSIVRNCMIYPDLFRKVMFSNPSPLIGGSEVGSLF